MVAEKRAKSQIGRDSLIAFNNKFMSPNQKEGKNAIYRVNAKFEQPNKSSKPSEAAKESKMDRQNEHNEQTKLKEQFRELFT